MEILFEDGRGWIPERQCMYFWASVDGQQVRCVIPRETMDDHFGDSLLDVEAGWRTS